MKLWRKGSVLGLGLGLSLIFTVGLTAQSKSYKNYNLYTSTSAVIAFARGQVFINDKPVVIGQVITDRQTIRTGKSSTAEIVFSNKNILSLRPQTVLRLNLSQSDRAIEVSRGGVLAVLKKLDISTRGQMSIKTPSAVAGVRGTSFYLNVYENGNTYFCLCNGALELSDNNGKNVMNVESSNHKAMMFTKDDNNSVTVKPIGLIEHSSRQVNTLAKKIGTTIDWTRAERSEEK